MRRDELGDLFFTHSNVSGLWLDVEKENATSNDLTDYNFKPIRCHKFMTATKTDQFCAPFLSIPKNEQQIFCLKMKKSADM